MIQFTKNNIYTRLSLGERLKERRLQYGISLEDVSSAIAIAKRNLESLEEGQFTKVPEDLYRELFLKTYAIYLGFNWDDIKEFYEKEKQMYCQDIQPQKDTLERKNLISSPKMIANSAGVVVLAGCFGYLLFLGFQALKSPGLVIETPHDNSAWHQDRIIVTGKTISSAEVRINGERVIKNHDGRFQQEVGLSEGLNSIRISASKKYGKEEIVVRNIIYQKERIVGAPIPITHN